MNEAAAVFNMRKAKEEGKGMASAVMLKAKLKGLIVDRKEVGRGAVVDYGWPCA